MTLRANREERGMTAARFIQRLGIQAGNGRLGDPGGHYLVIGGVGVIFTVIRGRGRIQAGRIEAIIEVQVDRFFRRPEDEGRIPGQVGIGILDHAGRRGGENRHLHGPKIHGSQEERHVRHMGPRRRNLGKSRRDQESRNCEEV